ncbi:hypothetical protein C8R45DRAFT_1127522 [Mycena sanguinolenta]|nr:hypothetical protein C8R45DRAFT_1127522 [Mycena sanguinolenta]
MTRAHTGTPAHPRSLSSARPTTSGAPACDAHPQTPVAVQRAYADDGTEVGTLRGAEKRIGRGRRRVWMPLPLLVMRHVSSVRSLDLAAEYITVVFSPSRFTSNPLTHAVVRAALPMPLPPIPVRSVSSRSQSHLKSSSRPSSLPYPELLALAPSRSRTVSVSRF